MDIGDSNSTISLMAGYNIGTTVRKNSKWGAAIGVKSSGETIQIPHLESSLEMAQD